MNFQNYIDIPGHRIGPGESVLIIAEAGVAHFGDPCKARDLVDLAADAGADVLKVQAFHTDALVSACLPEWRDRLRPKEVDFDFLSRIKERCDERGILFLCTPHESSVLPWLDEWDVPLIKIGSGERGNTPFFREIAKLGKPVILSTGMYAQEHINQMLMEFSRAGLNELALMHCVTSYPAPVTDVNLRAMESLRTAFDGPVGYSDHTQGHHICLAAVAMGAQIIEKHITLDFNIPNAQDWKVSCGPDDFAEFVRLIREVESARGSSSKSLRECEKGASQWALKSLVSMRPLSAGHVLAEEDMVAKRPGNGISPAQLQEVIGRVLRVDLAEDDVLEWSMLQ